MLTTVAQIDPVCGMTVDPERSAGSFEYKGTTYYFCSTHCLHRFRENPEQFLTPAAPQPIGITRQPKAPATPTGRKYTCPMHPEIIRDGPGSCPICGMALEPLTVSLEEVENHELKDMTRRSGSQWPSRFRCSRSA
jgi:Cu+-exporting ATPase